MRGCADELIKSASVAGLGAHRNRQTKAHSSSQTRRQCPLSGLSSCRRDDSPENGRVGAACCTRPQCNTSARHSYSCRVCAASERRRDKLTTRCPFFCILRAFSHAGWPGPS